MPTEVSPPSGAVNCRVAGQVGGPPRGNPACAALTAAVALWRMSWSRMGPLAAVGREAGGRPRPCPISRAPALRRLRGALASPVGGSRALPPRTDGVQSRAGAPAQRLQRATRAGPLPLHGVPGWSTQMGVVQKWA